MKTIHGSLLGLTAASPGHGIREKLQGVGQATQRKNDSARDSKVTTRAQKAKTDCAQTSGPEGKAVTEAVAPAQGGRVSRGAGAGLGGVAR